MVREILLTKHLQLIPFATKLYAVELEELKNVLLRLNYAKTEYSKFVFVEFTVLDIAKLIRLKLSSHTGQIERRLQLSELGIDTKHLTKDTSLQLLLFSSHNIKIDVELSTELTLN
jgi:hypothetical protein